MCRLQHHSNPYLRLCPYKLEELNQEPIVIVFHDFISITDCDEIISHASPNMRLSTTGVSGNSGKNLKTRTSKQAWINDQTFIPYNATLHKNEKKFHIRNMMEEESLYNLATVNNISSNFVLHRLNQNIELATLCKYFFQQIQSSFSKKITFPKLVHVIGPQVSEDYQVVSTLPNNCNSQRIRN